MASTVVIDPVTRIEGHLRVSISIDQVGGKLQVVDAFVSGTLFRGFERILLKRHPWDAPHICERICGVCPVSHSTAAIMALEQATQQSPSNNSTLLRNLMGAANFLDSHILSFYHLALPDFLNGPAMPPWQPAWTSDKRLNMATTDALVQNYITALDFRRKGQEMTAIFGGRMPHPPANLPGGVPATIRPERVTKFRALLAELKTFISGTYLPDVQRLATLYPDYYDIGRGHGHLLAFGAFGTGAGGMTEPPLKRGYIEAGKALATVNSQAIAEQVTYSWYDGGTDGVLDNLKPHDGETTAMYPKTGAYSWLKAPRYNGRPCEVGPLARQMVNGSYTRGISVMDRHLARAQEASQMVDAMSSWLDQLDASKSLPWDGSVPTTSVAGEGMNEAPRGALGHWVRLEGGKIARYQVVTPTCWNASPRDASGVRGPIEEALIGTPILDAAEPVEALRVLHSFDPCTACAVHVMRPGHREDVMILRLP